MESFCPRKSIVSVVAMCRSSNSCARRFLGRVPRTRIRGLAGSPGAAEVSTTGLSVANLFIIVLRVNKLSLGNSCSTLQVLKPVFVKIATRNSTFSINKCRVAKYRDGQCSSTLRFGYRESPGLRNAEYHHLVVLFVGCFWVYFFCCVGHSVSP